MKVTVSYMAQLKRAVGISQETVEVTEGATVQNLLLDTLCENMPNLARTILGEDGAFRSILLVFIGDKQADLVKPFTLNDGDEVTLMFPIAGG